MKNEYKIWIWLFVISAIFFVMDEYYKILAFRIISTASFLYLALVSLYIFNENILPKLR